MLGAQLLAVKLIPAQRRTLRDVGTREQRINVVVDEDGDMRRIDRRERDMITHSAYPARRMLPCSQAPGAHAPRQLAHDTTAPLHVAPAS